MKYQSTLQNSAFQYIHHVCHENSDSILPYFVFLIPDFGLTLSNGKRHQRQNHLREND